MLQKLAKEKILEEQKKDNTTNNLDGIKIKFEEIAKD